MDRVIFHKISLLVLSVTILLFFPSSVLANKIDKLKSDADVSDFIHKQNRKLKHFVVNTIEFLYHDTLNQRFADSLGVKPWQKVDFNNDGLSDLLVYGHWNGEIYLIAIIDEGKKFSFHVLNRGLLDNVYFPIVRNIDRQAILILYYRCRFCSDDKYRLMTSTDTLIYKFGDFIEPNFKPSAHAIEKIEFSTSKCFGTCPVFELEIMSDRTAKYNAIKYNEKTGAFKTTIDKENFNSIMTLINYIDFQNLKENYAVSWTDDQSCTLKITFDDGKTKTIHDYGKMGTYGLNTIYSKLFALRKNQKWK